MPRIPKEQIPDDMAPELRKHVEGLYDLKDDNVCMASVKALGEMGPAAAPAAPFLASLLDRHRSCQTPNAAIDALVNIGKASVEPTILALKVGDHYGRERAIKILRRLKDPRAVAPLVNAVADGIAGRDAIAAVIEMGGMDSMLGMATNQSPEIRMIAMKVLPQLDAPNAADALVAALEDPNEKVRQLAVLGLNDLVTRVPTTAFSATNSILAALKAPDAETRRHTLRLVMRLNFDSRKKGEAVAPMLADTDPGVLSDAVTSLSSIKTDDAVALLRKVEQNPDAVVRAALATALGNTGRPSALEPVEALLADKAGIVRENAIGAIAALKGPQEAPRLIAILKADKDALVRRRILQILSEWKNTTILADLSACLADDDETVRIAALDLAGASGSNAIPFIVQGLRSDTEKVREHAGEILERNLRPSQDTAKLLIDLLAAPQEDVRVRVIRLLARDPSYIADLGPIAKAMEDRNSQVRATAIQILGQRKDKRRLDDMRAAVRMQDEGIAMAAVNALSQFEDVAALAEATRNPLPRVSQAALGCLARIKTPEAQKVIADLAEKNKRPDVHSTIAPALADKSSRVSTKEAVVASFAATRGTQPVLRTRLVEMGTNVTPLLVGLLTNDPPSLRAAAIDVLAEIKDRSAIATLINAIDDASPEVRERAVVALGSMRDRSTVEALSNALSDESPAVREQAVMALGAIADPSSLPALISLTNAADWRLRWLVVQNLGKFKDTRSVPAIRGSLRDANWQVRGTAAEALGTMGDRQAVPDLIAMLEDPHWSVRRNSAASLRTLTGESLGSDMTKWQQWWRDNQGRSTSSNKVERTN